MKIQTTRPFDRDYAELPEEVKARVRALLTDVAVAAGAMNGTPTGRGAIDRAHAAQKHPYTLRTLKTP